MKKILIITILLLLTGCTNIDKATPETLISEASKSKINISNTYRKGYKYYLPSSLEMREVNGFNEKIVHQNFKYYLYVDIVSYFNKVTNDYKVNKDAYISLEINNGDSFGYLEVNNQKDKYLIEIMYNYAKIEIIVDKNNLNKAITNSMVILSTIKYNDDIIKNMMGEDILNFNEEQLNIFEVQGRDSNFIKYVQDFDSYEDEIPDPDLIN